MNRYRHALPQIDGDFFLTDGGLETTLLYHNGLELPCFAAFDLLRHVHGRVAIREYYGTYARLANRFSTGLILESPTWRANADWGERLGYTPEKLDAVNRDAIDVLERVRTEYETPGSPMVISGCIGPREDGYFFENEMSPRQAEDYHAAQVATFAGTAADMVSAFTINYSKEAVGIVNAAMHAQIPVVISFTVELDGNLPTGQSLQGAIEQVDDATAGYASYYMINCAHPGHFTTALGTAHPWVQRVRGLRANASCLSHAELDVADELDSGDPVELGREYARLKSRLHQVNVMGGCCGTDHRHIEAIARACLPLFRATIGV